MKILFYLKFHTSFGQSLWISGNVYELGNDIASEALPMDYLNEESWQAALEFEKKDIENIRYKYLLKDKDGRIIEEWGDDRVIQVNPRDAKEMVLIDTWNHAGEFQNAFYTTPFAETLLKTPAQRARKKAATAITHIFRVKYPLLRKEEVLCLAGSGLTLNNWDTTKPVLLSRDGNWWTAALDMSAEESFPVSYKYGVYNTKTEKFIRYEEGDNRLLYAEAAKKKVVVLHDGFANLPNSTWKGAGVAIPVFSLRSKNSFGVGEFTDLKLLVDWAKACGLKLIQLLPVNDTVATNSWLDSYPYAAISAFALHPLYINLEKAAGKKHSGLVKSLRRKQKQLNEERDVNYTEVMKFKMPALRELYAELQDDFQKEEEYKSFFESNKEWLTPYAAFCYLRDKYNTAHFENWKTHSVYNQEDIGKLCSPRSKQYSEIAFWYFVQYHLHLQLKEAADYAHKQGVVVKGDIPIGIYRYGCDAWVAPALYNMNMQAGAPPDDFAITGQNWGFPTYNWKKMQEDGYGWWRLRFEQMSNYFDAFRIDHILGFFRIWSIPMHAVQGIMGRFVPATPVSVNEFGEKGIWFDYHRFCKPYINDAVLQELFGEKAGFVRDHFLEAGEHGDYLLKPDFTTQQQVETWFETQEATDENHALKLALFELIANVIVFEEEGSEGTAFHFRIAVDHTISFRHIDAHTQEKLKELYINYFFRRQDEFWKQEAMQKLPSLKKATNMLICGEDLGMVPHCVPEAMQQLGILSLEIQRMPKDPKTEFFSPKDAPYLSVVTPSTHDMSTVRGWWEENREKTQRFYNHILGQWGEAPVYCEAWINRAIVMQHLYSPAMWSIFQLQDILGMDEHIRRENPSEERINVPADPKNQWKYRMHLNLEDLVKADSFNQELKAYVENSGRG